MRAASLHNRKRAICRSISKGRSFHIPRFTVAVQTKVSMHIHKITTKNSSRRIVGASGWPHPLPILIFNTARRVKAHCLSTLTSSTPTNVKENSRLREELRIELFLFFSFFFFLRATIEYKCFIDTLSATVLVAGETRVLKLVKLWDYRREWQLSVASVVQYTVLIMQ